MFLVGRMGVSVPPFYFHRLYSPAVRQREPIKNEDPDRRRTEKGPPACFCGRNQNECGAADRKRFPAAVRRPRRGQHPRKKQTRPGRVYIEQSRWGRRWV